MQQVAMRGMDFDHVKFRIASAPSRLGECFHRGADLPFIESDRIRIIVRESHIAGRHGNPSSPRYGNLLSAVPRPSGAALSPCMRQLNSSYPALAVDESRDAREHFDVLVFPNSQILRADARFGQYGRCFSEDERSPADGSTAEMYEVPIRRETVRARILTHRRDDNPVAQHDVANL